MFFFNLCSIHHCQMSTQVENHDTWQLTTKHIVLSFENTGRVTLMNKRCKRRSHNSMPWSPDQTFSWSCCNHDCQSSISHDEYTSISMDQPLLDLCFIKPSHKTCAYICIYIKTNVSLLIKWPAFPDILVFPRFFYNFLSIHRWFNIKNIIPPSPDDGSLELKRYSVNCFSINISFYLDYIVINFFSI